MRNDHAFCRTLLKVVLRDVALRYTASVIREAWVWTVDHRTWEFHGPNKAFYSFAACCAYEARAKGWEKVLAA